MQTAVYCHSSFSPLFLFSHFFFSVIFVHFVEQFNIQSARALSSNIIVLVSHIRNPAEILIELGTEYKECEIFYQYEYDYEHDMFH